MKLMKYRSILPLVLLSLFVVVPFAHGQKLSADEIIAKHLDSIAPAEKRSALKTLVASGEVRVDFVTQKNQPAVGRIVIASEGGKLFLGMSTNASDYSQEVLIFNGDKASVGAVRGGKRSTFGEFIQSNGVLLSHGLLSGTMSSSWAPMNFTDGKAKVSTSGGKKIDGRETYGISYSPKGGSDLNIKMYFDQETFRHVRTEYTRTASASMGRTPDESSRNIETRLKLVEDFGEFKDFHGFMLPGKYTIFWSVSGQNGTTEIQYTANMSEYAVNQKLDAGTFGTGE